MSPAGFEPTVPASDQPQTHVLDRAATVTGVLRVFKYSNAEHINYSEYNDINTN